MLPRKNLPRCSYDGQTDFFVEIPEQCIECKKKSCWEQLFFNACRSALTSFPISILGGVF